MWSVRSLIISFWFEMKRTENKNNNKKIGQIFLSLSFHLLVKSKFSRTVRTLWIFHLLTFWAYVCVSSLPMKTWLSFGTHRTLFSNNHERRRTEKKKENDNKHDTSEDSDRNTKNELFRCLVWLAMSEWMLADSTAGRRCWCRGSQVMAVAATRVDT